MSIELTDRARKVIERLIAAGKFASADEAVNALITRSVPKSTFDGRSASEIAACQKQAMTELLDEISDMPVDASAPQFSGRDHDQILYGGDH